MVGSAGQRISSTLRLHSAARGVVLRLKLGCGLDKLITQTIIQGGSMAPDPNHPKGTMRQFMEERGLRSHAEAVRRACQEEIEKEILRNPLPDPDAPRGEKDPNSR